MRPRLSHLALTLLASFPAIGQDVKLKDTVGAKPPEGAIVLFNGKSLEGWLSRDGKAADKWGAADGIMTVKGGGDIHTEKTFNSFKLHIEFNCPYMPDAKGQARGNSGVYLQGRYELQVLDSYGLPPKNNECGAIYQQIVPAVNACKPPLQWQSYDVTFHAAQRDGNKVTKRARISVVQNGVTIIDDKEIDVTPGGLGGPAGEPGPLLLQDHGNPVQFKNIWIVPIP